MTDLTLHPIHTDRDYRASLKRAEAFFDLPQEPDPDSAEGAYFEGLLTLIEAYEQKHFPIPHADPIEAIRFRLEQSGQPISALQDAIGNSNRVYEVLSKRRPLTLRMIRELSGKFGIPADVLIQEYPTAPAASPKMVNRPATSLGKKRRRIAAA